MRLKEDSTSWRSSSIIKRDARHGAAVDGIQPGHARKNTWKWCKGIVGREHVWEREVTRPYRDGDLTQMVCQSCGKQDYRTALWGGVTFEEKYFGQFQKKTTS